MTKIPFTVSARTARLIGRENVAHAEGAVIELVKNSYDADSDFAFVVINPEMKTIIIYDNGIGMSENDIKYHWMTIGTDNKEKVYRSEKGRIKAGAKGIGRFALDRLGHKCTMHTVPKGGKQGYKWSANWNDFEKPGANIGTVYATLENCNELNLLNLFKSETSSSKAISALGKFTTKHGTLIKIEDVRDEWTEEFSQKIFRSLEILTPPDGQAKFAIYLFNEQFKSSFGKVENESFNDYDYKLIATYKKNSQKEIDVKFYRNEFDYNQIDSAVFEREEMKQFPFDKRTFKKEQFTINKSIYELIPGFKDKDKNKIADTIGDFVFTYYFFKLGTSSEDMEKYKTKSFNLAVRRNWANKFGGIKLFRDNFRVRPYGEVDTASYDWLMLGERKAESPAGFSRSGEFRVSPYQIAGTVNFSRVSKLFLDDKSGREGLIENDTFLLFKNILIGIIRLQEDDRSTIASNLLEYYNEINADEKSEIEALEIANSDGVASEKEAKSQNKKLKKGIQAQKNKIDQKDEELVMSRAMASAGILIASFSHEFHYIKNRLNNRSTNLKNVLLDILPESKFRNIENRKNPYHLIAELKKLDEKIKQWIEFSISLTRKDRRRAKKINLVEYFNEFKKSWKRNLDDRGVSLNFTYTTSRQKDFHVKMIELDIDTIFDNLLANSIEAFQRDGFKGNRIISLALTRDEEFIDIDYRDSGPGLSTEIKKPNEIFKAFVTTKRDATGTEIGTGLGMWLLKSSVDYNKGSVKLYFPEKGFQIKIKLKSA